MEPNNFLNSDEQARDPWAPQPESAAPIPPEPAGDPYTPEVSIAPTASSSLFAASEPPVSEADVHMPVEAAAPPPIEPALTNSFEQPAAGAVTASTMFDSNPMEPVPAVEVHELVESGPKGRKFEMKKMLGAGLAVAVLAAGSTVAFNQFNSSDGNSAAEGGSASPQLVVEEFMSAVEQEDFLGAAQLMEPTERRTLINPGIEMVGELQRIGVLGGEFDMSAVQGVDVQMGEMAYVPETLASNVVRVGVTGEVTTIGTAGELPLGPLITENVPAEELNAMAAEVPTTEVESIDDLGIVAVERDGAWYVSLWYSVAEGIRREEGIAQMPSFGNGPTPSGGETPEAAVQAMTDAVSNFDPEAMIASLDPQEAAALYDYSTLFLDMADEELAEIDEFASVTIDRLDMTSVVDGDNAMVTIEGMAATVNFSGETFMVDTGADCLIESFEGCQIEESMLDDLGTTRTSLQAEMAVHKVDGTWYVSPTSTLMNPMLDAMADLDQAKIQGWIDDPESLFENGDATALGVGSLGVLGLGAITLLGSQATQTFEEVSEAVTVEDEWTEVEAIEDEWTEQEWDDEAADDWDTTTTTAVEPGFVLPDEVEVSTTQGPAEEETDDNAGPIFTLPDAAVPTETTVPPSTTTAPTTTVKVIELVTVYQVQEFAAAGTGAFDIFAEPVQIPVDDAVDGSVTKDDVGELKGKISSVDLEPGAILNWDNFEG